MRNTVKKILFPFLNSWYKKKNSKVSFYENHGIKLKVLPNVFHPGIFLSTNIFIEFLSQFELKNQSVLELGAGSGMISFYCAKNGAKVTSTDINKNAIAGLKENSESNQLPIEIIESNLFENVQPNDFDYILINPPYYPKNPSSEQEKAFFCGADFEYFKTLFAQLQNQWTIESNIFMILSEDCELEQIKSIASSKKISLKLDYETKKLQERNYIFRLQRDA